MTITTTITTTAAATDSPTMSARLGVLVSLGRVVVGEAVGTEVVTAATPTPSTCTHSHNTDESLLNGLIEARSSYRAWLLPYSPPQTP